MIVMFGTEVVIRVRNHQLLNSLTLRAHGLDNDWFQDGEGTFYNIGFYNHFSLLTTMPDSRSLRICLPF